MILESIILSKIDVSITYKLLWAKLECNELCTFT
jgi:hypothetical protein